MLKRVFPPCPVDESVRWIRTALTTGKPNGRNNWNLVFSRKGVRNVKNLSVTESVFPSCPDDESPTDQHSPRTGKPNGHFSTKTGLENIHVGGVGGQGCQLQGVSLTPTLSKELRWIKTHIGTERSKQASLIRFGEKKIRVTWIRTGQKTSAILSTKTFDKMWEMNWVSAPVLIRDSEKQPNKQDPKRKKTGNPNIKG